MFLYVSLSSFICGLVETRRDWGEIETNTTTVHRLRFMWYMGNPIKVREGYLMEALVGWCFSGLQTLTLFSRRQNLQTKTLFKMLNGQNLNPIQDEDLGNCPDPGLFLHLSKDILWVVSGTCHCVIFSLTYTELLTCVRRHLQVVL